MKNWTKLLTLAVAAIALAACTSTPKKSVDKGPVVEERSIAPVAAPAAKPATPPNEAVETVPLVVGGDVAGTPLAAPAPAGVPAVRVVHFDYDSSVIKDEDRATLDAHATYLSANAKVTVTLEGHTDERGSREYNMALGERRATAVQQYLKFKGVAAEQLKIVSYGEERPLAMGSDESAWSQNRRVELVYPGR